MKKILIALLTFAMVFTLLPTANTFAENSNAQTAVNYVKTLNPGTYNIQAISTNSGFTSEFGAASIPKLALATFAAAADTARRLFTAPSLPDPVPRYSPVLIQPEGKATKGAG